MSELRKIRRALISVSDKTELGQLAAALTAHGAEIISTGGTARFLRESGARVTDVSEVTGFPEMMDGRVKTLHPKIHGAFLALRDNPEHVGSMREHGIEPIDLVVVNLYPFERTIEDPQATLEDAVENIDIGGPAMIRSAAKNWRDVAVLTSPGSYPEVVAELDNNVGSLSLETRARLAAEAYSRTAEYDTAISAYLTAANVQGPETAADEEFPDSPTLRLARVHELRYGENPHQRAAVYSSPAGAGIAMAEQLHGKEMSFNNYLDADAAWRLVQDFEDLAVVIIKHTNPSGVGVGKTNEEAYRRALSTDPVSAFGGIVAFNRRVAAAEADAVNEVFTEVVLAPDFNAEAVEIFATKKNLRVLKVSPDARTGSQFEYRQISGGMLVQQPDQHRLAPTDMLCVTERHPSGAEEKALMLAWSVCKHVKSNAIVLANELQTLGVGAGQMNRVDSVRLAAMRAERFQLPLEGAALASDAFFPFRDNVDEAARFGVKSIVQPGGSIKDSESIAAANEHGIAMIFTGIRHFRH